MCSYKQGSADSFLANQLTPGALEEAAKSTGYPVTVRMQVSLCMCMRLWVQVGFCMCMCLWVWVGCVQRPQAIQSLKVHACRPLYVHVHVLVSVGGLCAKSTGYPVIVRMQVGLCVCVCLWVWLDPVSTCVGV